MALTKKEIVNMLREQSELPKNDCTRIVESFFDTIKCELEKGNPGWPLENPPSVAGSKSPSDSVLTFTLFPENRQSYSLLHPSFSFFSLLWESRVAASLSR